MNFRTKFRRLCLKLLLPTILTSSLPFYPYQKDERALPGYFLTRRSFSPSDIKRLSLSSHIFSLYFYSYTILSDSLSLSPALKGQYSLHHSDVQCLANLLHGADPFLRS
jgi:hypothetical protein